MAAISIKALYKNYGKIAVLRDINLDVAEGEFVVLVGPSGCGKSTLLRSIAGLEQVDGGDILFDGHSVVAMPPQQRNIAMVFQTYALYPHMSVRDNIAYGLKAHKFSKQEIAYRLEQAANILQLKEYLHRRPVQLSGGQRQRVAMARAMVREPTAFLYDEPLSNLDAYLRVSMREEIKNLHQRLGRTSLYVTHDQVEAMTMGDRIVVMKDGLIRQIGTPMNLYDRPDDVFVATFIGSPPMNILSFTCTGERLLLDDGSSIEAPQNILRQLEVGRKFKLGLRPEQLYVQEKTLSATDESNLLRLTARVKTRDDLGQDTFVRIKIGQTPCVLRTNRHMRIERGQSITLNIDGTHTHFFHSEEEGRAGKRLSILKS